MSRIAYMRVSTRELNIENQRQVLEKHNIDKYFSDDGVSGKSMKERQGLKELLDYVREDDYIYVVSLDRLARNQKDQEIISAKIKAKGATIVPLDIMESLGFSEVPDSGILKMVWNIIEVVTAYKAEQERKDMLRRQSEGIKRAKSEGKYAGTKPKYRFDTPNKKDLNTFNEVIKRLSSKEPILKISNELGLSRNTIKSIKMRERL